MTDAVQRLVAALTAGEVEVVDLTQPLSEHTPILRLPEPFANIEEFQLRLTREGHFDRIALRVEPAEGTSDQTWADMAERLAKALAEAHEGLRFEVERAAAGELPRFELKARRTVDLRDQPIGAEGP